MLGMNPAGFSADAIEPIEASGIIMRHGLKYWKILNPNILELLIWVGRKRLRIAIRCQFDT